MFRTLLVPLDGTPFGEQALPLAVSVARRSGATLHLVSVHVPTVSVEGPVLLDETQDLQEQGRERAYLAEVAGRVVARAPDLAVTTQLQEGRQAGVLADALLEYAAKAGADLIVLSSHGRTGLARWWFGNVADDLVHRTSLPLLLVHTSDASPCWEPEPVFRHILVALDGSPLAEQILAAVAPLGACMGSEYSLLRVVEPVPVPVADPAFAAAVPVEAAVISSQQEAARAYLRRVSVRLRGELAASAVHACVVLDPDPAEAILSFVERTPGSAGSPDAHHPVDLIALATHGRSGLSRLLLGSIGARILKHTTVPLFLQRPVSE
ncbi:MAG: universal stress protein [Planctomycetes bacterium]|nr:universal stress protein [Planctomycetota bacterium]